MKIIFQEAGRSCHRWRARFVAALLALMSLSVSAGEELFPRVADIFARHCLDCHSSTDPDGQLVLETHEAAMKGGESGPSILPGRGSESLLMLMVEGKYERDGRVRFMPPGRREKLNPEELAVLRAWIDAGAPGPAAGTVTAQRQIDAPVILPRVSPLRPIHAAAEAPARGLLAVARPGEVELYDTESHVLVRTLQGPLGMVNALVFSPDGRHLFAAGGESGIAGVITQWAIEEGAQVRTFEGHADTIFGLAISPDGKVLASGGYDQLIKLWDASSGEQLRAISGHNGCVHALSFRPDGKILASASADRTVKLWAVETGNRLDTLTQPLKEQYTLEFLPDGKRLAAAGVDNRIRVWEISESAAETTNPLLLSRFAHEKAILRLRFSPDGKILASSGEDHMIKLWNAHDMSDLANFESQPDWATALAFISDGKGLVAGRLDGTLAWYNTTNGATLLPAPPELAAVSPRGIQRGFPSRLKLTGKHLSRLELIVPHPHFEATVLEDPAPAASELWVNITTSPTAPRGAYELRVKGAGGESAPVKLYLDDLPQVHAEESARDGLRVELPATVWGSHARSGDSSLYRFQAREGETIVFNSAARSLGSKANLVLTLQDHEGKVLASQAGTALVPDPSLAWRFEAGGEYALAVSELIPAGSPEHFYRVSIGQFAFVTGWHPSAIQAGQELEVELAGHNIPINTRIAARADPDGKIHFSLDPERYRTSREVRFALVAQPHTIEEEPNDSWQTANTLTAPGAASGRIWNPSGGPDEDWFRFEAEAGREWILETRAAQLGSPLDTRIEIRDASGAPVPRVLLQAVRDSAVTFRPIDSNTMDCRVENWEEMELTQYLYMQGEVVRLFRAPQGPDSGFLFYGINGKRRTYFDTTPAVHANGEPCYIVEPHPPGTDLLSTGLPIFTLYYENDDDGERKMGTDSRLHFTPPSSGTYYARVTDSRGFSGPEYSYLLVLREARPDFKLTVAGGGSIARGSGQSFTINADRIDGFDEEIRVDITDVPPGFTVSTPVIIEAGHVSASGTIHAALDAAAPPADQTSLRFTATAQVRDQTVEREVSGFGKITLADSAALYVELEPEGTSAPEITIAPGGIVPARLRIHRKGHDELVTFNVANLPHGIIVDNIGLNGVLIPKDQNEREIFFRAERWVPETDRWCYAISNEAGRQTSRPLLIKVRQPGSSQVTLK